MSLFIQVYVEAEQHIISVKRVAVGKRDAAPQLECVVSSVSGNFPGLRQRSLCALRVEIDVNQVRKEEPDQLFRRQVDASNRVQGLRVCAQRRDELSAAAPDLAGRNENVLGRLNGLSPQRRTGS